MKLRGFGLSEKAASTTLDASNIIRVSQGEPDGIGLEVFLKAFIMLPANEAHKFILYCGESALKKTLSSLNLPYSFKDKYLIFSNNKLKLQYVDDSAFACFDRAISDLLTGDVLFTLPATKKSFPKDCPGHTAYLRWRFKRN